MAKMEIMMGKVGGITNLEKVGGITNHYVLFIGRGHRAAENRRTMTKVEMPTGKGWGLKFWLEDGNVGGRGKGPFDNL